MKVMCILLPHFFLRCEIARNPQIKGYSPVVVRETGSQKLVLDYSPELADLQRTWNYSRPFPVTPISG